MKLAFAAAVAVAVGLVQAPPAGADEYDYLNELDANGIYYSSSTDVINLGKQLCHVGRTASPDIFGPIVGALLRRDEYGREEGIIILGAAADHMCPDIIPAMAEAS